VFPLTSHVLVPLSAVCSIMNGVGGILLDGSLPLIELVDKPIVCLTAE
jgi:hypothetical protein